MPAITAPRLTPEAIALDPDRLRPSPFSLNLYGDPDA